MALKEYTTFPRSPKTGASIRCSLVSYLRQPTFWWRDPTPLQGIESKYSKPCRQDRWALNILKVVPLQQRKHTDLGGREKTKPFKLDFYSDNALSFIKYCLQSKSTKEKGESEWLNYILSLEKLNREFNHWVIEKNILNIYHAYLS